MTKFGLAALVAVPLALAACQKAPPPPPPPVQSPGEAACAAHAASLQGVQPSAVTVTPTSSTKTGATIYTATANGVSYRCVVEVDSKISAFGPAKAGD